MEAEREQVGVVGVGWVGLVTATCFAELGHPIVALDVNAEKVESLRRGEVTIHEPGLAELLAKNAERITFTTSMDEVLKSARLLFCCVDTPPTYSGDADLSRVRSVVDQLPEGGRHALVMKSTVPSGTGASIRRDKPDLRYVSCPEFLKEGSAIEDFMHPDRVVIGADPGSEDAADAVERLYERLGGEIVRTDVASAEMIKLASNAFLATKISFINEIANVCEQTGADVTEVARGMGLDKRIGASFLKAGIGYGGSCFAHDVSLSVKWDKGEPEKATFGELWKEAGGAGQAIEPPGLEVLSWVPGEDEAEWMPVSVLTRRQYLGDLVTAEASGISVEVTEEHPFVAADEEETEILTRVLAAELDDHPWLIPTLAGNDVPGACVPKLSLSGSGWTQEPETKPLARSLPLASVAWSPVRIAGRRRYRGPVYSLKVPGSQTVVVNGGLIAHQCFPKDVNALKQLAGNSGYHFQLLNAVIEVNELQKRRVIAKLEKHLGSLADKRIALLGLAFKPDTDDMREASSLVLSARLQGEGAEVVAYDPVAGTSASSMLPDVDMAPSAAAALEGADAAVLVTEWPEFSELDWVAARDSMASAVLIDGRNYLDGEALRAAGFAYEGIGRPDLPNGG